MSLASRTTTAMLCYYYVYYVFDTVDILSFAATFCRYKHTIITIIVGWDAKRCARLSCH